MIVVIDSMPLLWERLARQLDQVRASQAPTPTAAGSVPLSRQRRLEEALAAIEGKGSPMMIASLKAAIEGREASFELPGFPAGITSNESGPEAYLKGIEQQFKPQA